MPTWETAEIMARTVPRQAVAGSSRSINAAMANNCDAHDDAGIATLKMGHVAVPNRSTSHVRNAGEPLRVDHHEVGDAAVDARSNALPSRAGEKDRPWRQPAVARRGRSSRACGRGARTRGRRPRTAPIGNGHRERGVGVLGVHEGEPTRNEDELVARPEVLDHRLLRPEVEAEEEGRRSRGKP
jgi:hypothetical protein